MKIKMMTLSKKKTVYAGATHLESIKAQQDLYTGRITNGWMNDYMHSSRPDRVTTHSKSSLQGMVIIITFVSS